MNRSSTQQVGASTHSIRFCQFEELSWQQGRLRAPDVNMLTHVLTIGKIFQWILCLIKLGWLCELVLVTIYLDSGGDCQWMSFFWVRSFWRFLRFSFSQPIPLIQDRLIGKKRRSALEAPIDKNSEPVFRWTLHNVFHIPNQKKESRREKPQMPHVCLLVHNSW